MANIAFKIIRYEHRSWWRRKYDVRMAAKGFMVPDTAWVASFWTVNGARKYVDRTAKELDYKVVESAMMQHDES